MRYSRLSLFLLILCQAPLAEAKAPPVHRAVIDWSTDEGVARLERSRHKVDFFPLVNQFESQTNRIFCGPTSATIVLNALRLNAPGKKKPHDNALITPQDRAFLPEGMDPLYERYTQNTFFDTRTDEIKTRQEVMGKPMGGKPDFGFQLRQFHSALEKHGLAAVLRVAGDKLSDETIKKELIENLKHKGDFVLVNYARPELGQKGGGHISPLGAYDEASDSFLILDVNPNAAPWVWVTSEALIKAMRTKDTIENRGYLLIAEKK